LNLRAIREQLGASDIAALYAPETRTLTVMAFYSDHTRHSADVVCDHDKRGEGMKIAANKIDEKRKAAVAAKFGGAS
jgi:hypothetical protein